MSWIKFDLNTIKNIPVEDVIEALGGRPEGKRFFHCFNGEFHNNNDKRPSLAVDKKKNTCRCYACGVGGDNIDIVSAKFNINFREACTWLHESFGIPYLEGDIQTNKKFTPAPKVERKITYWVWDEKQKRSKVYINSYRHKIPQMSIRQKLRWAYTYIYRASLMGDQSPKEKYFAMRGIKGSHKKLGYISYEKARSLMVNLRKWFSRDDLEEIGLKSLPGNSIVFPSFTVDTDMVDGMMLRLLGDKRPRKEHAISAPSIEYPLPFGMIQEKFQKNNEIWLTEGAIDGLSLQTAAGKAFVAIPGAHGWRDEMAGLFKDKKVVVAFDNDQAGIAGSYRILEAMRKIDIEVEIFSWEGEENDLNDLLLAGKLSQAVKQFEGNMPNRKRA